MRHSISSFCSASLRPLVHVPLVAFTAMLVACSTGSKIGSSSESTSSTVTTSSQSSALLPCIPFLFDCDKGTVGPTGPTGPQGATGPQGPAGVTPQLLNNNGTRLVGHYLASDDGARQFDGTWRDTSRNEDCKEACDENGQMRCLPLVAAASSNLFVDSACTIPAAIVPLAQPTSYLKVITPVSDNATCTSTNVFYPIGSTVDCSQVYTMADVCTPTDVSGDPTSACYGSQTRVAPASFVAFTRQ